MDTKSFIAAHIFIGVLFIGIAIASSFIKPKEINPHVGYRSKYSKLNQDTWEEANRYSAKATFIAILAAVAVHITLAVLLLSSPLKSLLISLAVYVAAIIFSGILTEVHLRNTFNDKGEKITKNE